jgi:hypothetical protein
LDPIVNQNPAVAKPSFIEIECQRLKIQPAFSRCAIMAVHASLLNENARGPGQFRSK